MLAEDGLLDSHLGAEQITNVEAHPSGFMAATSSSFGQEYPEDQVSLISLLKILDVAHAVASVSNFKAGVWTWDIVLSKRKL